MHGLMWTTAWIHAAAAGVSAHTAPRVVRAAYRIQASVPHAATAAAVHSGSRWGRWVLEAIDVLAVLAVVCCVMIQRRAMNRIAFGRSVFISGAAIVTGFIISLIPTWSAAVVGSLLMLLGFGLMVLMAVKSYQHLRKLRHQRQESATRERRGSG